MQAQRQETCEERIGRHLASRLETPQEIWNQTVAGEAEYTDDGDNLYEFGLSFDYVAPETFNDQYEGYWRYQLSCGGPSDEFRFFVSPGGTMPYRIEYWFLDWCDGASLDVTDRGLIRDIWEWFEPAWFDYDYEEIWP